MLCCFVLGVDVFVYPTPQSTMLEGGIVIACPFLQAFHCLSGHPPVCFLTVNEIELIYRLVTLVGVVFGERKV